MSDEAGRDDATAGSGAVAPPLAGRPTRAIIDLDALAGNVRAFRALTTPETSLLAVVKANAYGHGAVMVARAALAAGADQLAVATVDEGAQLRRAGIGAPVLVLGPIDPSEARCALAHDLTLTVADRAAVDLIARAAVALGRSRPAPLHLKLDTGMRRFGAMPEAVVDLARRVRSHPTLSLEGLFTHFATADEPDETFTREQAACLDRCVAALRADGLAPPRVHAANSAATLRSRRYDYGIVRLGIAMYGLPPSADVPLLPGVRPVMTVRSRVARLIDLAPGDSVSYGRTYVAARPERAALIPIGYADGYRRGLSGRAWMGWRGASLPIHGRVCMDQTVVGVPDGVAIRVGEEIEIVGSAESGAPSLADLATLLETIPYEVAAGIAARVPRHYVRGSRIVAVEDLSGLRALEPPAAAGDQRPHRAAQHRT